MLQNIKKYLHTQIKLRTLQNILKLKPMTIQDLMAQHNMSQNALLRAINANRLEKWKADRTKKRPMRITHSTLSTILKGENYRHFTMLEVLSVFDCELEIVKNPKL